MPERYGRARAMGPSICRANRIAQGQKLATLRDAALYITKLPKAEHDAGPWQTAMQVEAVVKMLQPGFNVASIAAKRRNKGNPWFMRGALFRSGGRAAAC